MRGFIRSFVGRESSWFADESGQKLDRPCGVRKSAWLAVTWLAMIADSYALPSFPASQEFTPEAWPVTKRQLLNYRDTGHCAVLNSTNGRDNLGRKQRKVGVALAPRSRDVADASAVTR